MSFDDCDVVADAKSPFSTSTTDRRRSARGGATPAPAIPPPTTTTSYSASSSGQGRPCTGSGAPTPHRRLDHSLAPQAPAAAPTRAPAGRRQPSPYCPATTAVNFGGRSRLHELADRRQDEIGRRVGDPRVALRRDAREHQHRGQPDPPPPDHLRPHTAP